MATTALIAYAVGTEQMLDTCLSAIERHIPGEELIVRVITDQWGYGGALDAIASHNANVLVYDIGFVDNGSEMHGKLLNSAIKEVDTEYVLTLDSDCFPISDNWLGHLVGLHKQGSEIAGILWPWIPPPEDLNKAEIEYRIRRNHCWNNTQVVCQLVRKDFVVQNGLSFVEGDDTGFSICDAARSRNLLIGGLMPTRCALPRGDLDPEFNRHVCVIYGDMIYHQGGSSRKAQGASIDPLGLYDEARERVFQEKGAEWIMADGNSHRYRLDREEEVAQFKMNVMFREMLKYLETHDRLFDSKERKVE